MNDNMDFEEYIRQGEPDKKESRRLASILRAI